MPHAAHPVPAHVAVLRLPEFDARPVGEQAALKDGLERWAREALGRVAEADRLVLDADDGLAVVLFGDPARALDLVQALHAGAPTDLQVGLNHGPLALTSRGRDGRVYGDGLSAAAAAARFASPTKILITQDFAHCLEAHAPARAAELGPAGDFTDSRVRLHSLYTPDPTRRATRRRRFLRQAVLGVAAILLLGVAARFMGQWLFPAQPAIVTLAIKPRGDVFVDGIARGRTPPLQRLEVAAGRHVIAVRHAGFSPLELTLTLKAGEQVTVAHTFAAARPAPRPDFWRDLRRRFGGKG
jgi:PEGA domain-containing protein